MEMNKCFVCGGKATLRMKVDEKRDALPTPFCKRHYAATLPLQRRIREIWRLADLDRAYWKRYSQTATKKASLEVLAEAIKIAQSGRFVSKLNDVHTRHLLYVDKLQAENVNRILMRHSAEDIVACLQREEI